MNTGITLIDYQDRYSTKEFFMKRIRKTFVPFVSWSLIGLCFKAVSGSIDFNTTSFSQIFNSILAGRLINVYWFFPVLFCIYLCIPLFASISKNKRNSVFTYLLCCGFIINNLLPFLINVLGLDMIVSTFFRKFVFHPVAGSLPAISLLTVPYPSPAGDPYSCNA